ncbi:MAG: hypothetical protein ACOYJ2_02540 [Rickettsiales bacterium]
MLELLLIFPGIPLLLFIILAFLIVRRNKRARAALSTEELKAVPRARSLLEIFGIFIFIIVASIALLKLIKVYPMLGLLLFTGILALTRTLFSSHYYSRKNRDS